MHIIIKKTFLSLPFVSHSTTFGKKPYRNLWHLITYWTIFTANLISSLVLATKIFCSRTSWQNCFGSVNGTVLRIFRPKINQNIVYNGHKRAHGISFKVCLYIIDSSVTLVAPMWVNRMIVPCHTSLGCSPIYKDQYWHNNQPFCIYGDPAFTALFHLQATFSRQNLTPNPVNYNKAMSHTRVPVDWLFNKIETYSKFVSYTNICLFSNSP